MKKRFSERYGFKKQREFLQIKDMDRSLRNRLWNKFRDHYLINYEYLIVKAAIENSNFFEKLYDEFFKLDVKPPTSYESLKSELHKCFFKMNWFEVYDFIEYVSMYYYEEDVNKEFRVEVNKVLEEEMSGYRFLEGIIVPIIDEVEIKEVEEVFNSKYEPVKRHLLKALKHLSNKRSPDYINSMKESITAVEAMTQILTGRKESDLGKCLKVIKLDLNKHFKKGLNELYNWTNKEDGIRHANTEDELKTSPEEAKFFLVICFVLLLLII